MSNIPHVHYTKWGKCCGLLMPRSPGQPFYELVYRCQPTAEEVREILLGLRRDLALSRAHIAAACGASMATIKAWESGRRNPSPLGRKFLWMLDRILRQDPTLAWMRMAFTAWSVIPGKRSDAVAKTETREADGQRGGVCSPVATAPTSGSVDGTI
ncbi:MAG: helix-turn-helix domain-containing protein [Verrucomicrobiia bacterium]